MRWPSFFCSTEFNYQNDSTLTTQLNYGLYESRFHWTCQVRCSTPTTHLANAAFLWIPFILLCAAAIWFGTKDYATQPKSLASQLVAAKRLHTWVLSLICFLTFGCFVAMGASLPLIIKEVFASAPGGAPKPLLYAPWAAAVATIARPLGGWLADKFGAGLITSISVGTMAVGGFSLSAFLQPHEFIGFFIVSCLGALGGFVPPLLLGWTMDHLGGPAWAYTGMAFFALTCLAVNIWFYHRRGSPSHG